MSIFEWFKNNLDSRQVLVGILTGIGILLAVLFITQLENLPELFPGQAEVSDGWQQSASLTEGRAYHASTHVDMSEVDSQNDSSYVYTLGGVQEGSGKFKRTAERIELDSSTGAPLDSASWESAPEMNFGRAAFEAVQVKNHLYAIGGHITIAEPENQDEIGLPFSTISRLDLRSPDEGWKVVATAKDFAFMPEVELQNDDIHVTGGVFGVLPLFSNYEPGSLPSSIALQELNEITNLGGSIVTDRIGQDSDVSFAFGPIESFNEVVRDGIFYTTVDTHIILENAYANPVTESTLKKGDLASHQSISEEYTDSLEDINMSSDDSLSGAGEPLPRSYKVSYQGLEFGVTVTEQCAGNEVSGCGEVYRVASFSPIPQGRFGHAIFDYQDNLNILGGAILRHGGSINPITNAAAPTIEVIEDEQTSTGFESDAVTYNLHIALRLSQTDPITWNRSNHQEGTGTNQPGPIEGGKFTLPDVNGDMDNPRGRAFHEVVTTGRNNDKITVIAGVENGDGATSSSGGSTGGGDDSSGSDSGGDSDGGDTNGDSGDDSSAGGGSVGTVSSLLTPNKAYAQTSSSPVAWIHDGVIAAYSGQTEGWSTFNGPSDQDGNALLARANFEAFELAEGEILVTGGLGGIAQLVGGSGSFFSANNTAARGSDGNWEILSSPSNDINTIDPGSIFQSYTLTEILQEDTRTVGSLVMSGGSEDGSLRTHTAYLGSFLVSEGQVGDPDAEQSTVEASPETVVADGNQTSTVTVTINDVNGNPVPGIYVHLQSSRNEASGETRDQISDDIVVAGNDGRAQFDVSSTHGSNNPITFTAYFGETEQEALSAQNQITGEVNIDFLAQLSSISPNFAEQGEVISRNQGETVTLSAHGTHFTNDTQVYFTPPEPLTLDINSKSLMANETDTTLITAQARPAFAGQEITFEVAEGTGDILDDSGIRQQSRTVTLSDTDTPQAQVEFIAGDSPGVQVIEAQVNTTDGQDTAVAQSFITQSDTDPVREMNLTANPQKLSDDQTQIEVRLSTAGGDSIGSAAVNLRSNTDTAQFDASGQNTVTVTTNDQGFASTGLTVDSSAPNKSVTVVGYAPDHNHVSDQVKVTKSSQADNDLNVSNIQTQDRQTLEFDLEVGSNAPRGMWQVHAETEGVEDSLSGNIYTETAEMPGLSDFAVGVAQDTGEGPRIISITPNGETEGNRLLRGTDSQNMTLSSRDTNFSVDRSEVRFTPVPIENQPGGSSDSNELPGDPQGITAEIESVSGPQGGSQTMELAVDIASNAKPGYWNVAVQTIFDQETTELAEMEGNEDIFISVRNNGYMLDMSSSVDSLMPDGNSTADITARAGRFSNNPGAPSFTPLSDIAISFETNDDGSLSSAEETTDSDGRAQIEYIVDDQEGTAVITGQYTADDPDLGEQLVISQVEIEKTADSNLTVEAPLEAREYDGVVALVIKPTNSFFPSLTTKLQKGNNDMLQGLPFVSDLASTPNEQFTAWVKAKNHLARSQQFSPNASGEANLVFDPLPIGDIAGQSSKDQYDEYGFDDFHDNTINQADVTALADDFGDRGQEAQESPANFNQDDVVNFSDIQYFLENFDFDAPAIP